MFRERLTKIYRNLDWMLKKQKKNPENDVKAGTGNRTRDLRTTNATLYRLSHASKPIFVSRDYVSVPNTISFVNQKKEKKRL